MNALITRLIGLGLFRYLGIGAIGLLIWYTGPYISFLRPVLNRLIAIVIVVVVYLLYLLIRKLLSRRKENRMSQDLATSADGGIDPSQERSDEEIATLKEKFDEALQILRKSGKGKFRHGSLYSLPWYMIIGPPGAGKTTLLVNSGLQFPLAEKMGLPKLQGVGGTRFCDWWFTDEAVIVDTAGRYTTQDSDETVDNAAWMGFLRMLKKNRKRRPINGIIVAISIDELTRQSEVDRERAATAVTQRIQELYEQLGVRFPIYVMFTKCDLLSGFMEFYSDLDRHEREQVWGTTFPVSSDPLQQLDTELELLQQQLNVRLVQRLQQERDPQRRNLIYNFPGLTNSAKPLVRDFIERVFKPSRYTATPFLRGVYFTSGTQEGTPFNRLISQLARNFSLSNASAQSGSTRGKSFFIKDLLSKVIFGESGLAGANLKAERVYGLLRTAGLVALATLPLILVGLWWMSSSNNHTMMDTLDTEAANLDEQIQQVSPENTSLIGVLPALNEARELPAGYAAQFVHVPVDMRFGLYQGGRLARNLTVPAYRRLLENAFLSRLMLRIEQQMRGSLNSPELAYQALKTYLMLGDDERLNPAYVKRWVTTDWKQNYARTLSREQYEQLTTHLDALLTLRPITTPFDLDRNLIEHIRGVLEQTTYAQRAYAMIKSELLTEGEEFTVAGAGGADARQALIRVSGKPLNRGVPAMFSPNGYYQSFIPVQKRVIDEQEDEFWIFGTATMKASRPDKAELTGRVSGLYFKDYIHTWWEFLEDVRIRPFSNFVEAAEILKILTSEDSPLVLLLQGAAEKTKLAPDIPGVGDEEGDESLMTAVGDLFKSEGDMETAEVNPIVVNRAFAALNNFVSGQDNQPSPLNGVKEDVRELYFYINTLARGGTGAATAGAQQDIGGAVNKIRMSASYAPEPMNDWISELADQSEGLVAGKTMGVLDARWRAEVVPFCRRAIANRYPFSLGSDGEVSLQDFGQFFGPGGKLDQFFNNNLAEYIDTNVSPWRVHSSVADIIHINAAALQQMQLARKIQRAFFSQGGAMPATSFDLKPVGMDPNTTHFMLNIDGQRVNYSHGPLVSETLKWPGSSAFSQVQIQFSPATSIGGSRTEHGAWAWFRMLDTSSIQASGGPEQFKVTFKLEDRWVTYELRARSAYNPFKLSQLRSFRCVPNL
jgi:type VI secretion system protein ImpL